MKNPELEQELSQDELLRRFVKMFPIEARLEGITPEQLRESLAPETLAELIRSLPPEILDAAKKGSS